MTSSEKILAGIREEAEKTAAEVLNAAKVKAQQVSAEAKTAADARKAEMLSDAQKRAELIRQTGKSAAELSLRDKCLAFRREKIEEILDGVVSYVNSLDDKEYFAHLAGLAQKLAIKGQKGELRLCTGDLKRDTRLLSDALCDELTLSETPAVIDGGFMLVYGDIEIDAGIRSLIREKREALVDSVNGILFDGK